ncbi:hypothetical protein L6452_26407 [Arctium lappa]|uniref:Uncharacterized protein n=1 Tax=Arctium lappa TaxID=4217 RepID=A0ACB8ZUZ6_ARCLA|nr:hypothetical protein L6452_26407 [Arctium lappa]
MVDYLNLSKPPLTRSSSSPSPPPPPPPPSHRSNMSMLYYGLLVVATATIVLALYNLIIVRWCANQFRRSREANHLFRRRRNPNNTMLPSHGGSTTTISLTSSFRYKKGSIDDHKNQLEDYDVECSVCLSVFEDGEQVRKLPRCNHSFHASCIDMWLYSHFDCPLCRAPVVDPPPHHRRTESDLWEHSQVELLDTAAATSSSV